jgi:copper(I)-binding protein
MKRIIRSAGLSLAVLFTLVSPLMAHDYKAGDLELKHPWSRATPNGARVAAGYVKIVNTGAEADRLVSVSGEISGRSEIHEMSVNAEGVMTMRPLEGVEIPAGGEVELKPGGLHIMFLELKDTKKDGERFAGTLSFEKAGTVDVEFSVEAMAKAGNHGGNHGAGHEGHAKPEGSHAGHGKHGG